MVDDNIVQLWIKFLEYLNEFGFDYYIGEEWIRNHGVYDHESHRFVALERTENTKSYIYYETMYNIYEDNDISFYTVMTKVLPEKYTVHRWRGFENYAYLKPSIHPKDKTKMVLDEFNKGVMI